MEEESSEVEYRIGGASKMLMATVAGVYDGVQMVLAVFVIGGVLNWVITGLGLLTFGMWFPVKGVSLMTTTNLKKIGKGATVEVIPYVNAWPSCTRTVLSIIKESRQEDEQRHQKNLAETMANAPEPEPEYDYEEAA